MKDFSILIGGEAGFGIDSSAIIIAKILNQFGFNIYIYREYPSLIRGGHTFAIIRAAHEKIAAHRDRVDFILALNQDCIDLDKRFIKDETTIIYDSGTVKTDGIAINLSEIIKEEKATAIMKNSILIGALCSVLGIDENIIKDVFKKHLSKYWESNLKVALRGYNSVETISKIEKASDSKRPILTGNDAISLGLVHAGLDSYLAYPMTPTSGILHFLAKIEKQLNLKVIHPESETSAVMMALGLSSAGSKVAIGTSGGGFCLMTEGLSFAAMAELPVVFILGQRPGPSTGLPTYSTQTELNFALHSGHGEFLRFITAPGDAEEAYYWSGVSLNIAWKYQIPSILLTDKTLSEGMYSFDKKVLKDLKEENGPFWDKKGSYKRFLNTENGISPLAFYGEKNATIKINSYEHDEYGITIEDSDTTMMMQNKRLGREKFLLKELENYETVKTYGDEKSSTAILCWGSNKGVCVEVAKTLGLKVIQPIVLSPFPQEEFKKATQNIKNLISVENNATGQLSNLIKLHGFGVNSRILKYDGRPFIVEELINKVKKVLK
ncbi:MAG: 2-oxoglutarate oxidoreductase subunit KorA [Candidatus Anoxychlamydiales bacterium]|nr:2-oxoglutarate oxidoreductase subunit KorA [Candidatus Anoxychlamydiales bacterium]